jgi:hypothetical protein
MSSTKVRQLSAFMQISLDGYFCDAYGDMNFAHKASDDQTLTQTRTFGNGSVVFWYAPGR